MRSAHTLLTVVLTLYGAFVPLQVCHAAGHGAGVYGLAGIHAHDGACEVGHACLSGCRHDPEPSQAPSEDGPAAVPGVPAGHDDCCVDTRADIGVPRVASAMAQTPATAAIRLPIVVATGTAAAPPPSDRLPSGVVGVVLLR